MNIIRFGPGRIAIDRYIIPIDRLIVRMKARVLGIAGQPETSKGVAQSVDISFKLVAPSPEELEMATALLGGRFAIQYKPDFRQYVEYGEGEDGKVKKFTHEFPERNPGETLLALYFADVMIGKGSMREASAWMSGRVIQNEPESQTNRAARRRQKHGIGTR